MGTPDPAVSAAVPAESFEDVLRRLKQVVERLEGGELPLEDALRAFEDGVRLTRTGTAILDAAERRVEVLVAGNKTEAFPDAPVGQPLLERGTGPGEPRGGGR